MKDKTIEEKADLCQALHNDVMTLLHDHCGLRFDDFKEGSILSLFSVTLGMTNAFGVTITQDDAKHICEAAIKAMVADSQQTRH